ncbi:NAD(P)-binding Rossmann-fold superfamily protein isoform 8, partial [Theobroma cacao]
TNSEVAGAISNKADSKDEDLAFVAGATGRVGSRTVRELLKLGFQVRAGVRSAQKAETLVQSVKQMKLNSEGTTPVEKLEIVEYDLEKQDTIAPALGNASVVICCIGAGEKEVFDITGPYRIDYQATQNLIHAATVAKVNHFILVSSLGTNKVGFPAAILNLFWGVLIWKRKAEEALIASGLPYTSDQEEWSGPLMLSRKLIILPSLLKILYLVAWCQIFREPRPLSPYTAYDDLKPPSSPSPTAPTVASADSGFQGAELSINRTAQSPIADKPSDKQHNPGPTSRPLSPFTMYEDLKPPTSPIPSSRKS